MSVSGFLPNNRKQIDFDCGIAHERIASWLVDELGMAIHDGTGIIELEGGVCEVRLERLSPRVFAGLALERTRLLVKGDAEAVDLFERRFTLRFMSAGG